GDLLSRHGPWTAWAHRPAGMAHLHDGSDILEEASATRTGRSGAALRGGAGTRSDMARTCPRDDHRTRDRGGGALADVHLGVPRHDRPGAPAGLARPGRA